MTVFRFAGFELDEERAELCGRDGTPIRLRPKTFEMLRLFAANPGRVLSRELLLSRVWGMDFDPGSNVVDVYVRYLRGKLGADHIVTVRGAGYRWE